MSAGATRRERTLATVMSLVRWALVASVTAVAGASVYRAWGPLPERAGTPRTSARYYCPMHPEVTADQPGECPICHMQLEPVPTERTASHRATPCVETHPSVRDGGAPPEGVVPLALSLDRVQLGGIVSEPVRRFARSGELRFPAGVEAPESGVSEVHTRASGFLERVDLRETGRSVSAGQTLAGLYSPQILQAQQEFLAATRWASDAGAAMATAARQNLSLLGMEPGHIDAVARTREPMRVIPLRANSAGVVTRRAAVLGAYVTPETTLYEITSLGRVWVMANVPESALAQLRVGTTGRFVPLSTGALRTTLTARVAFIEPSVSRDTRTARVRMELANPGMSLRPGMLGDVFFSLSAGQSALRVPRDAVIDTGRRRYVFVDRGEGRFDPRTVTLGDLTDDGWEVRDGVSEGERVVTRGAFLVDAESRLQSALAPARPDGGTR